MKEIKYNRIDQRFAELSIIGRTAFLPFITAGDPDFKTSMNILSGLPDSGADLIELGMPFSDPIADGYDIQAASARALKSGQTMKKTFDMVRHFRNQDNKTPIILMGYYNPIYVYGVEQFVTDAKEAGVDGVIVVDLPQEADQELCIPAIDKGICFIRLVTPTTDHTRLVSILQHTSGFVYYVSTTGITGTLLNNLDDVAAKVEHVRASTTLPIGIGFGIKTPSQVAVVSKYADAVIAGSVLVRKLKRSLDIENRATNSTVSSVLDLVSELSAPLRL